ncbi:ABC transporter ATP-binding protein [Paenibacillus contaminans]|uniref:ABC transporter ATP-binding protein n=1 Tax=Paenibacillus contaminans TaxID=450362 RepID=A0A329MNS4_9BACL|nr:energy-coupling factor transporter ATPase [Paenibacillus contaminans]RAV21601.1 ABC transporter ATP-binding protein [Paenibacillus contaminans]
MKVVWEKVSFTYPGNRQVMGDGFSLTIADGETVLLLGPSGSGKSTLALCLCGLVPHAIAGEMSGTVRIDGIDTRLTEPAELAKTVGMVFQDPEAQAVMSSVEDEVAFGLENTGVPSEEMEGRIAEALRSTGLSAHRSSQVDNLSGGQKQRLALASVLAMKPAVLVLDEPTSNLDPAGTGEVFEVLRELKSSGRHTIVLIEHKLDELMEIVDRVAVIDRNGELVCSGSPGTVFFDWAEELERLGVWVPKAVEIARKLSRSGIPIDDRPVTIEQLAETLRRGVLSKPAGDMERTITALCSPSAGKSVPEPQPILLDIRPTSSPSLRSGWLQPLDLQVRKGEFWALAGENGAGKTTLARHLIGLLPVRPRVMYIDGRDCKEYSAQELAHRIGYVFQNPEHQFVTERVSDEIAFGMKSLGMSKNEVVLTVERLLSRFGLSAYADSHPFHLSHGQKRRLSVAVMLAVGQELLILDEPTFGQDRRHTAELMEMLKELQSAGRTIMMITHDMTLVAEYAEYAAVMSRGAILYSGPVDRLFSDPQLLARGGLKRPPAVELSRRLADLIPPECAKTAITMEQRTSRRPGSPGMSPAGGERH